jgi:L-alanine-DL-glutamate epimerase-like enolase superfamily enzyme
MLTSLQVLLELTIKQWLFVKITDSEDRVGWGESSLEGALRHVNAMRSMLTRLQYVKPRSHMKHPLHEPTSSC